MPAHDDDHGHPHHGHADGPGPMDEAPMDAANQSLADALRTSFRILKLLMVVLVALFLLSGVFTVEQNEEAVVLRLGRLSGDVRQPGLHWAFPYPIDQVVRLPVRQSNELSLDSHWLHLRENERDRPITQIQREHGGLKPGLDGALLTADGGLFHIRWKVIYSIEAIDRFVSRVKGTTLPDAEAIITPVLENAAFHVAAGMTADEMIAGVSGIQDQVRARVNRRLEELQTGVRVTSLHIPESSPPVQTLAEFRSVTDAEQYKQRVIRDAEQEAANVLNQAAGGSYTVLLDAIDDYEDAVADGDAERSAAAEAQVDEILENTAAGEVGWMIAGARSYYTSAVQGIQADIERYRSMQDEFARNPTLLVARLVEDAFQEILTRPGVTKIYLPTGAKEVRVKIGPDPQQRQLDEAEQYKKQAEGITRDDGEHPHPADEVGGKIE